MANPLRTRLEFERRSRGWSQADLCDKSGVAQTLISQIEVGRRLPREHELEKLANALGITPAFVLLYAVSGCTTEEEEASP